MELLRPVAASLPGTVRATVAAFSTAGEMAAVPLHSGAGSTSPLAIASRRAFDAALLDVAQAAGAQLVPRRVTELNGSAGAWRVHTGNGPVTADWLVGADGANSLVRRRLGTAFSRHDLSIASGYYVDGQTGTRIDIEFTDLPPGYLWSFPRLDHLAVGVCGQADETSSSQLQDAARRWILEHTASTGGSLTRYSWPIPTLSERTLAREQPCGSRWLLIGDAAGLVDPITREGIFFALQSAEFATHSIMSGHTSMYAGLLEKQIYSELRYASRMKAQFFGPSFRALLVSALRRSDRISAIMVDLIAGRQTYRGLRRRLLTTGELRLAWAYLRL